MQANNYFKLITTVLPRAHALFPFDDLDLASAHAAWSDATTAQREVGARRIVVWRRPEVRGPWDKCSEVAP